MSQVNVGHRSGTRGVAALAPPGRRWGVSAPVDCFVSISPTPAGDAVLQDFQYAWIKGGGTYEFLTKAGGGAQFLSGVTFDPNGDAVPTPITYTDLGASNI